MSRSRQRTRTCVRCFPPPAPLVGARANTQPHNLLRIAHMTNKAFGVSDIATPQHAWPRIPATTLPYLAGLLPPPPPRKGILLCPGSLNLSTVEPRHAWRASLVRRRARAGALAWRSKRRGPQNQEWRAAGAVLPSTVGLAGISYLDIFSFVRAGFHRGSNAWELALAAGTAAARVPRFGGVCSAVFGGSGHKAARPAGTRDPGWEP